MLGPYPEFAWSFSKSSLLRSCQREYYWQTYGMWGGWDALEGEQSWLAYRLKHLTTPAIEVGLLVHECARDLAIQLKRGFGRPEFQRDFPRLEKRCRASLQALKGRSRSDFLRRPKQNPYLHSLYYEFELDIDVQIEQAADRVASGLTNLIECDIWDEVSRCEPSQVLVADALAAMEVPMNADRTDPVKVFGAPDLVFLSPDDPGVVCIVDWKTGAVSQDAHTQLGAYALFMRDRYRFRFADGRFRAHLVSLSDGKVHLHVLTREDLIAVVDQIRADVAVMRSFQADPEMNRPVSIERFELVSEDKSRRCRWCNFYAFCADELAERTPVGGVR